MTEQSSEEESTEPLTEQSSEEESSEPETEEGPRIVDTSDPYNLMGLDILKERSALWQQERRITAAILDTGIDTDHPLLDNRISEYSVNLLSDRDSDAYEDANGHGTHVAGIIAKGTSDQVELMAVRIFDDTNSSSMVLLRLGIDYAVEHGADVINISITFTPNESHENLIRLIETSLWDAISKGCVICSAAGNHFNNTEQYFPANDAYTIAAASIGNSEDDLAASPFSNHGRRVDFTAPGYEIRSSWVGGRTRVQSGTSMSCAFVSAAAAMIKLRDPSLSAWETYAIMLDHAVDLGDAGRDNSYGYGYLDLADYGKDSGEETLPHQALTARTDIITDTNSIGTLFDPEIRIVKGDGKLSYKTTDSSVAVIKNGKIKITGNGSCEIIVTASATDAYQKTERSIYVRVKKVYQTIVMPETNYNVTTLDAPFNLNVVLSPGDGASIRYIYDESGVITVDADGTVTPIGEGTAYIYPVASATSRYYETVGDMITVNVKAVKKLGKAVITSLKNTSKGMQFTWDPVPYAAGYYLYRNTGEGYKKMAVINDPSMLSYVDTEAIVNGQEYTFAVLPFNGKVRGPKGIYTYYRVATPAIKSLEAEYITKSIKVRWSKNSKATG
ncbi:MAG: S8 family serine peptidase, partial [Lachnospiraceae bacterium]|nr:S8 family serine peptidase [Lachnospiraceae bacterium]